MCSCSNIIYSFYFHVIPSRVIMEEMEKLKNVLKIKVRKTESNCFEQINRLIEKMKWKGELKNIKRDHFVEGFLSEEIIKHVM